VRGIDWRSGPATERGALPLRLTVDVGEDGALSAGDEDEVTVTVENVGTKPLYRVAALATDGALLEGREFLFGLLQPGEKRSYTQEIEVPKGWPAEQVVVKFSVRDSGREPLGTVPLPVTYASRPLPAFSWSWSVSDKVHGDGDGLVDAGEHLDIDLTVTNIGDGPSTDAFARLRNRAGTRVDLLTGTLLPGTPAPDCEDGDKCVRTLAPGETWHGAFDLTLQGTDTSPLEISLDLGDAAAYDRAAVWRSAFLDYFGQKEKIALTPGAPLPSSDVHRPPRIELTRTPDLREDGARTTISGSVEDDHGLSHVMVYVGDDKVLFEGGGGAASRVRSVPFTADVTLKAGSNVVTVLATDEQGFRATRSVVIWHDGQEMAKAN
jgi:carboxyl-terminal processing protease